MPKYKVVPPPNDGGKNEKPFELDMSFRQAKRLVEEFRPGWTLQRVSPPNFLWRLGHRVAVMLGLSKKEGA